MASLKTDYDQTKAVLVQAFKPIGALAILASFCMLAMPVFLFQVYDRVLISRSGETLLALLLICVTVLVAYGVFDAAKHALLVRAGAKFEGALAGKVMAAELSRQSDPNTQSLRDIGTIRQTIGSPVMGALFEIPVMPIFTIIIFLIHPVLGGVLVLGGAVLIGIAIFGERFISEKMQANIENTIATHKLSEQINGQQEMVRSQGMYREAVSHWGDVNGKQLSSFIDTMTSVMSFSSSSKTFRQLLQIFMIAAGALLVLNNAADPGIIFAASIIGSRALAPIEQVVGGWRNLKQGLAAKQRLEARIEDLSLPTDRMPLPVPSGSLALEGVSYLPRPGAPVLLKGINGSIAPGASVAVIGSSGAGKTTLARVLVGFLEPSAGRVTLDGQDLRAWDPVARGLHMGYVPQKVDFFEVSIAANIARLRTDDPSDLVIEAAKRAGIHEMIMAFPDGYDTVLSRQGFWPSGGQAQLLALARALYGGPRVLILDEPNAALDNAGERVLHQALARAKAEKLTVIVITQRPSLLKFVDQVMLMEAGSVKDFGPRDEVLAKNNVQTAAKRQPAKGATAKPQSLETTATPQKPTKSKSADGSGETGQKDAS